MKYDLSWDKPHTPSGDVLWQESDCYWFYDRAQRIGGFHRIGQKPATGKGQVTLFIFREEGQRFVLSAGPRTEVALGQDSRQDAKQVVGGHTAEALGDGRMRFTWQESESDADLEFYEPFHEPRNWSKTGHSDEFMSNINSDGHLECSGRIRGRIRIGSETYTIDGLCHRDRSWGLRDNSRASLHRYRMFSGTVGPELSFASFFLDLKGGPSMVAGFVARNGVDHDVRDLRVIMRMDRDGLTPLGSTGILTLETGEEIRIESNSVQGFLTPVPEAQSVSQDHISTFLYNGKVGFLDLEFCINPGRGAYIPDQADLTFGVIEQGLSQCVIYRD
ncbi:DUF7064 domain-containing protein [Hyphomonas sp. NPDC076900]|uniref:DUF7064 domain-containing protein n=1 Tax=unclassified Hyphomonas TaxID=2630699 RepID=UPI003CFD39C9